MCRGTAGLLENCTSVPRCFMNSFRLLQMYIIIVTTTITIIRSSTHSVRSCCLQQFSASFPVLGNCSPIIHAHLFLAINFTIHLALGLTSNLLLLGLCNIRFDILSSSILIACRAHLVVFSITLISGFLKTPYSSLLCFFAKICHSY